jgi:hypothetical protein
MSADHETGFMQMLGSLNGPLLKDEDVAREFTVVLLKRLFGATAAQDFLPLTAIDEETQWLVKSAHPGEPFIPGGAQGWYLRARKTDCMILELGFIAHAYSDEVRDIVIKALRKD